MMTTVQLPDGSAFAGLLSTEFVANSVPQKNNNITAKVEQIKCKAGQLALSLFDPDTRREVFFESGASFSQIFSQTQYGAGFTKGLSIILAYQICANETASKDSSKEVVEFAAEIDHISQVIFNRIAAGDKTLSDVRKQAEKLDNKGGYYDRTYLSVETAQKLMPNGSIRCALGIDPNTGHLIAKVGEDLAQNLLNAYKPEIEKYLTEEGKRNLRLPHNIGFVVVAYKDELIPKALDNLKAQQIDIEFAQSYIVPVRGDPRYSLIGSTLMVSQDITNLRNSLGLNELYSEGRPLRFTFAAVHTPALTSNNDALIARMKQCHQLENWMNFIHSQIQRID